MENFAGSMQMGMPAAADAFACGRSSSLLAWQPAADAKQDITTFVDVPLTHRHRRPWGAP